MNHFAAVGRHSRLNPSELVDLSDEMPAGRHYRVVVDMRDNERRERTKRLASVLTRFRRS